MEHRFRWALVRRGAAVVAALFLTSCVGSFEDFQQAVELARQKGTARMESDVVVRTPSGQEGQVVKVHVAAAFDLKDDRGELTMSVSPPDGEQGPSPCRMVTQGDATYLKVAGGTGWVKADLAALGPEQSQAAPSDPREAFEFLRAVFGDAEGVGAEQVRGVDTTHWRVFVDVDRLVEGKDAPKRGFFASLGKTKLPMDVWIDAEGLPRRIAYTVRAPVPGASVEVESSTDIFDYGKAVSIATPPPGEVRDEPNALKALLACMGADVS